MSPIEIHDDIAAVAVFIKQLFRLTHHHVCAPILLPAFLSVGFAFILFFAVGNRINTAGADTQAHKKIFGCIGPPVAQGQVVFFRASLVAMPLNRNPNAWALV